MVGEWTEEPFHEVIDFQEGPGIMAKDFRDDGIPLVRLAGLDRDGSVLSGCNYLDPETVAKRWSHFALAKGDILLSTSASLGRIAIVDEEAVGAIAYTGIIRMRPRDKRLFAPFIRYLLEGPDFQQQAEMVGAGSVIRHFGPMHLRQMSVKLPSPAEQRAIAHILGTLDDKIELNRRMSETLEAMARALFKSWFVDFDPVRAKAEGRLPAGRQATPVWPKSGTWCVYAIECDDGSIYIGHTENLERRFTEHSKGKGADWTKRHPPKRVAYWEAVPSQGVAIEREKKLKTGAGREWLKIEIANRDLTSGDPGLPQPPCLPDRQVADLFPARLVDSELGEIPEGWEVGCFGDVVEQVREQENPLSSPDALFSHYSIPAFDEGQWPKAELGENIKSLKSRVPAGVILLSKLNPEIERVWLVDVEAGERAVCSTEFLVLRPRVPSTRSYAYCLARSPLFRQQIEGLVTGTSKSHQRAHADTVLGLRAILPPALFIEAFDNCASGLLGRTLACRRESRTLAALRDTLLPKLISGELRVKDADRFIEANT